MAKKLMPIFVCLLFIPFLTVPALMDERYWFLQGSAEMDFSASNILSYGSSFQLPGRYMPLSGYLRSVHSYVGFETMTGFGIPLNIFEGIVHAFFLGVLFLSLHRYLINLPIRVGGQTKYLDREDAVRITVLTAFIFGGMASIRWVHNGLVAYVPMTFLPLITALLLATSARRLLIKSRLHSGNLSRLKLVCLAVVTSLWANLFYELAYVCVVLVVLSCAQEFLQSRDLKFRRESILHIFVYASAFLIYWIPMRIHLAKECAQIECYEGSQISSDGLFQTFFLNLVNPLPLIGPYVDLKDETFLSELSPFTILVIMAIVVGATILMFIQFNENRNSKDNWLDRNGVGTDLRNFFHLILGPSAIGVVSALLMSVSLRSQRIVELGNPYRHTPILWLAYSLIFSTLLIWGFRRYSRFLMTVVVALVCTIMFIQQLSNVNNSLVMQRSTTTVLKVYDEVIFPDYTERGNERRCSLQKYITNDADVQRYMASSSEYYSKVLGLPYCK
jgi:hypothetical protein